MKTKYCLLFAVHATSAILFGISTAHATLIGSESFQTTGDPAYSNGSIANNPLNYNKSAGTVGFGTYNWLNETAAVQANGGVSLTHNGLVGGSQTGSALVTMNAASAGRNSARLLSSTVPTSSSYFLSGLLRVPTLATLNNGDFAAVGFLNTIAINTSNISTGFSYGIRRDSDTLYLAAFAGGNIYNLADVTALTNTVYQLVLELDVNAAGIDSLTGYYAANGATELSIGLSGSTVETWSSVSDTSRLAIQQLSASTNTSQALRFDEIRYGTTLADVTALSVVPEPSTWMLMGTGVIALFLRRRRSS